MTIKSILCASLFSAIAFGLASCDKDDPAAGTFYGAETDFGFGKAKTYVSNDKDGNPVEVGIVMDDAAFNNFTEMSGDAELSLNYPAEAAKTPFVHQFIGFASHGHEPAGVYDIPHFDLHYYTTSIEERSAITPYDTVKAARMPGADFFPAAYFPTGLVPNMGVHWLDATSPELAGTTFTQTFIWGSFDNKITFLEPMITKQFIADSQNFETAIKQPAQYDQPGKFYPTRHGFKHENGEYRLFLSGFVQR